MGGGDHAHVDADQLAAADTEELALGQHAQQSRLQRQRHVADLVEEQGATVGLLEAAEVAPLRAGERAGLVAEQLAFEQLGRDRRGVEGDKRFGGARRLAVQGPRDQFLAGAGLAGDQHRQRRLREAADGAEQRAHGGSVADQGVGILQRRGQCISSVVDGRLARPERACGKRHRLVEVERFRQEFVRATAERAGGAGDVGIGTHHDHRQLRRTRLELVEQHQTVVAGHAHVGEQQVRRAAFAQRGQRIGGVAEVVDAITGLTQRGHQHEAHAALVVDDPDDRWVHALDSPRNGSRHVSASTRRAAHRMCAVFRPSHG